MNQPIMLLAYVLLWTSALIVGSIILFHVAYCALALCEILYNILFNRDIQ